MPVSRVISVALGAYVAVLAALSGLFEAFLVPYDVLPAVSVATLIVVPANLALTALGRRAISPRWGGAVPALSWFLVVAYFSTTRKEGDVVIPGTAEGLLFLLAGVVSAAAGAGWRSRRLAPRPPAGPEPPPPADTPG